MTEKPKKKAAQKAGKPETGLKDAVLKAALKNAAFDGFTDQLLANAGKEAGVDKTELEQMFPEGALSLIAYFSDVTDAALEQKLAAMDLAKMKIRDRIRTAIRTRLSLLAPNKEAARRASAFLTLPMHAALAARLLYRTVDVMWRAVGDTSTDFNFYTKRGILAGVYGAVLVRWFNDTGEDESATDAFLDARIENVMQFEKFKAKAKEAFSNFPAFTAWNKPKAK